MGRIALKFSTSFKNSGRSLLGGGHTGGRDHVENTKIFYYTANMGNMEDNVILLDAIEVRSSLLWWCLFKILGSVGFSWQQDMSVGKIL